MSTRPAGRAAQRAPRVVHLINGEYFGGSARVLVNYLSAEARTAEVAVGVFFPGELMSRLTEMGIEARLITMRNRMDLTAVRQVLRLARWWRADLLHTHQVRNSLLARIASLAGGLPIVTHVHSPAFRESARPIHNVLTGSVDRALAPRTRRFIAVSESLAAELRSLGIAAERIRVVPNGIPLPQKADQATRAAVRHEFGIADDEALVGMVANFRPRKGTEALLEASAALSHDGLPLRVLLVGEAHREGAVDYSATLRSVADSSGIADRVTLTGFRRDVERLIRGLDLLVLPSRFGEGLPMVLLEAMGSAVAVVTTPVEGIPELVRDGENGTLVPIDNPAALGAAMRELLLDRARRERLAMSGRATVAQGYGADRMARGIESVYLELLDDGRR